MALTDNLVAFWELEEASGSRADAAGANTLTDNNTVTSASGKVGNAASFTAANSESLSIVDNAALSMGDIDFTIMAWLNSASLPMGNGSTALAKYNLTGNKREYTLIYESAPAARWRFYVSPDGSTTVNVAADTLGTPSTSTWYCVICWHDATANTINITVNAGATDSAAHSGGVFDSDSTFYLGSLDLFSGYFFDGLLDQVGVWKRVLTSGERTSLYNSGAGLSYAAMSGGGGGGGVSHDLPLLGVGKGMLPLWPAWWRYQRMQEKRIRQAERDCLRRHAA
jgi:hypothetical protein